MNRKNSVADQLTIRENKLSLVERLADDLAHEIKNPLHSMVINLEVLRRRISRLDAAPNEELLRYAGVLGSELERVNRRVDLLLRMVRPQRESDEPTTVAEVMEELRELVELECERHEVTLRMEPPVAIVRAAMPRAATRQMILSLILKTLDSLQEGGSLHVFAQSDGPWLRLHFRATDRNGGPPTGLSALDDSSNLSAARALAERLGGDVAVIEPTSNGSAAAPQTGQFILSLPAEG